MRASPEGGASRALLRWSSKRATAEVSALFRVGHIRRGLRLPSNSKRDGRSTHTHSVVGTRQNNNMAGQIGKRRVRRRKAALRALGHHAQCPLWVISRHYGASASCPIHPQKRTFVGMSTMSALCQSGLTHCSNFLLLFDLPVGAANQRKRYARAECLSGFQMERWKNFYRQELQV
jgi:hypothetical protein